VKSSRVASFLQIRPGEGRLVALLAALFACLQMGQGIGANAADALFFLRFGVEHLPFMFLLLGGSNFVVSLAYAAGLSRFDRGRFWTLLLPGLALVLLAERIAMGSDWPALYPILWITVNVFSLILGTLVWNVAGDVCDTRQSKRLFSLFASAGILGGVMGNLITGPLAKAIGTENLLVLYTALLIAGLAVMFQIVRRVLRPATQRSSRASFLADLRSGLDFVRGSRLMQLIAVSSVFFSILFFSIAFPFNKLVSATYPNEADIAGFLGLFSGVTTAATFVVSLFVANRLYTRLGVVNVVLILVAVYLGGFVVWALNFSLATASAVRFAQLVVLGGVTSTAFNALFNVVPSDRRAPVLAFNSGVPSQLGVVLSGVLLILGERVLTTAQIFIMGMAVAVACAIVVWHMRRGYSAALIAALRAWFLDVFTATPQGFQNLREDAQARRIALSGLTHPKVGVRRISAEILGKLGLREAMGPLVGALSDDDSEVRHAALHAIAQLGAREAAAAVAARLTDPHPSVRADAIDVLSALEPGFASRLIGAADDPDANVRARVAVALHRSGSTERGRAIIAGLLASTDPDERVAGLDACAEVGLEDMGSRLVASLDDRSARVRVAAVKALGASGARDALAALLPALDDPDERVRQSAADALQSLPDALGPLLHVLRTGPERAQDSALRALSGHSETARGPLLDWAGAQIPRAFELRQWAAMLARTDAADAPRALVFLRRLLSQGEWRAERRILRALAIVGTPEAIDLIARGLRSEGRETRAQALEALDTLGDKRIVRALLPLLEESPAGAPGTDARSVLNRLSEHSDPWLRGLAVHAIGELLWRDLQRLTARARDDAEPIVREAAAAWAGVDRMGGVMADTLRTLGFMDRILFLRQVPIFSELAPEDLQRIAQVAIERVYSDREYLCRDGELGDEMFVVVEGRASVTKASQTGARIIRTVQAGEHIGELAALRKQPRSADVVADGGDVRALVIGGDALKSILRDRPEVALAMLATLAERLSTSG